MTPRGVIPHAYLPMPYFARQPTLGDTIHLLHKNVPNKAAHDFAVIKVYIEAKQSNPDRSYKDLLEKLNVLEKHAPESAWEQCVLIREYFGFPLSPFTPTPLPGTVRRESSSSTGSSLMMPVTPPPRMTPPPPPYKNGGASAAQVKPPLAKAYAARPPLSSLSRAPSAPTRPTPPPPNQTQTRSASMDLPAQLGSLSLGRVGPDTVRETSSPIDRSDTSSPASIILDGERALRMLGDFDTVFVIDDSSSMLEDNRWEQARSAVLGVVGQACKYDDDGVDIYFLNAKLDRQHVRKASEVHDIFEGLRPDGPTPTGTKLEKLLHEYMRRLESASAARCEENVKPLNIIVITDGAPTDDPEDVIVRYAARLDRGNYPTRQVGIQFFQVGNDPKATEALKDLDDELKTRHGIRDMVDTEPYKDELTPEEIADLTPEELANYRSGGIINLSPSKIVKVLLGGINRRMDRKG